MTATMEFINETILMARKLIGHGGYVLSTPTHIFYSNDMTETIGRLLFCVPHSVDIKIFIHHNELILRAIMAGVRGRYKRFNICNPRTSPNLVAKHVAKLVVDLKTKAKRARSNSEVGATKFISVFTKNGWAD